MPCDAHPGHCDDPIRYELLLLDSHNGHVPDDAARAENEIEAERRRLQAIHAAQVAETVVAVADVLLTRPMCRSYPSVWDGTIHTVCRMR